MGLYPFNQLSKSLSTWLKSGNSHVQIFCVYVRDFVRYLDLELLGTFYMNDQKVCCICKKIK